MIAQASTAHLLEPEPPDYQLEAAEFAGYLVASISLHHRVPRCDVWRVILHLAQYGEQMEPEKHWEF